MRMKIKAHACIPLSVDVEVDKHGHVQILDCAIEETFFPLTVFPRHIRLHIIQQIEDDARADAKDRADVEF